MHVEADWRPLVSPAQSRRARSSLRGMFGIAVFLAVLPFFGLLREDGLSLTDTVLVASFLGGSVLVFALYLAKSYQRFERAEFGSEGLRVIARGRVQVVAWNSVQIHVSDGPRLRVRTPFDTWHLSPANIAESEWVALLECLDRHWSPAGDGGERR